MLGKKKLWQNRIIDVLAVAQKLKWVCSVLVLFKFSAFNMLCASNVYRF